MDQLDVLGQVVFPGEQAMLERVGQAVGNAVVTLEVRLGRVENVTKRTLGGVLLLSRLGTDEARAVGHAHPQIERLMLRLLVALPALFRERLAAESAPVHRVRWPCTGWRRPRGRGASARASAGCRRVIDDGRPIVSERRLATARVSDSLHQRSRRHGSAGMRR